MSQPHPSGNPFPGLRSFTADEDHLFFGREDQTMELLQKLGAHRLVAVVGTSGSGKSSLVRCGLLSQLLGGRMLQAGTHWAVAVTHPGASPMNHLAEALLAAGLYDGAEEDAKARLLATLSRSHFGLVETVRQARLDRDTNFVLVVDQFEEIFRFNQGGVSQRDAANEFVSMLLQAAVQREVPIYIVLTMRSDFIGDCAQFENLAEAVNRGEYLIPRMTREQFKQTIEGPIHVAGGSITPRLLQRLLNDLGEQPDQLPCLQHALMRTWEQWKRASRDGGKSATEAASPAVALPPSPPLEERVGERRPSIPHPASVHPQPDPVEENQSLLTSAATDRPIDLEDYDAVGRMREALSRHADEIYGSLGSDHSRQLCAGMFKAITLRESENRGIRRPQTLGQLAQILEVPTAELTPIIEAFRQPGVTFLMPPATTPLTDATVIDISHESLMRVWVRLRNWVEEEAASVGIFHRLAESAALHEKGKAGLYRDPELGIALSWREEARTNAAWADQYGGRFARAMSYLDRSREAAHGEEQEREAARQRELERTRQFAEAQAKVARLFKRFAGSLAVGLCLAVVLTVWAFKLRNEANRFRARAEAQTQKTKEALVGANHEQGKTLLMMARGRLEQQDHFGAKLIAASAIGFSGFGREQQPAAFGLTNLDLLRPGSPEREEVARLLRDQPDFMPIWTSPNVSQHGSWLAGLAVMPDGRTLISAGWEGKIKVWNLQSGDLLKTIRVGLEGEGRLVKIDLSPDGRWLAGASTDRMIRIWDTTTWEEKYVLRGHKSPLALVRFSPDGKTLASASQEGAVNLWETGGFTQKAMLVGLPPSYEMGSLQFHPQGFLLATPGAGQRRRAVIWDLQTGTLGPDLDVTADRAAFSPDGRWLALVSNDYQRRQGQATLTLLRWELKDGMPNITAVTNRVLADAAQSPLVFSPDGQTVACVGEWGTLFRFTVPELNVLPAVLAAGSGAQAITFTPDGAGLLTAGVTIRYFELPSGKPKWVPESHLQSVYRVAFSPNGRLFASAGNDGDVRLWETATGRTRFVLQGMTRVRGLAFREDGFMLATALQDGTIHLWDTATGAERAILRGHRVRSLALQPGGQGFATGGEDGSVRFWSWDGIETHRIDGHGKEVYDLAFSPDGRILAFPQEKEIELWDWKNKKPFRVPLTGHAAAVGYVAFSPDGALLASGGMGYAHAETRLWDLRTGATLQRWYESRGDGNYDESSVAFTPDGRHLVRGLRDRVEWHEIAREQGTTARVATFNKRYGQRDCFALSPDGRLLLIGYEGSGLALMEASPGSEAMRWYNPDGDEFSGFGTDISADGRLLGTGTRNGSIRIWELATGRLLHASKVDETSRAAAGTMHVLGDLLTSNDEVIGVRFSPDGQRLYSVYSGSGLITMWEFKDGWHESASANAGEPVQHVELSPDGGLLVTDSRGTLRLWDAKKMARRRLGKITGGYEMTSTFHPNRPVLATFNEGIGIFDLTDPNKPREAQHFPAPFFRALKYSLDGKYLAGLEYNGPERIIEADTGKLVSSLGPTDGTGLACDFSPDGRWFAVGTDKKLVRIWDVQTGQQVAVLPGHSDRVNHVQFTPDGRRLVTVCSQMVRVWDMQRILHGSFDYASYRKDFKIDGEKVVDISSLETSTTTNLYQSVMHPLRPYPADSLVGLLNETGDQAEQARQLFWRYYRARNLSSAREVLREVEADGKPSQERQALAGLYRATAQGNAGNQRFPLALQQIEAAIELAPNDVESWQAKADVLEKAGDNSQALSAADHAIQLSPETSESWAVKAKALENLSNQQGAAQAWAKAIDLAPEPQKNGYRAMRQAGKPMAQTPDAQGWVQLFDGRTLSGWKVSVPSRWEMKDGELTGQGAISHLYSPLTYTNLEFRAEVMAAPGADAGMYFRATTNGREPNGYEAQIANTHTNSQKTGSLYDFKPFGEQLVPGGAWFTLHIIAIGNRIIIKVNDQIVTDFVDDVNTYTSGHLALQQAGAIPRAPGAIITYRNVMVKPLPDDAQAAWTEARKDVPEIK